MSLELFKRVRVYSTDIKTLNFSDNNDLLIGLLVTFAMIIVIGCLAFLAFFYRESLKKWWINHPGGLKYRSFTYQ